MCTTNRLTAALAAVACCAALAEAGPSASPSGRRPQTAASPERSRILSITTQQTPEGLAVTIRASGRIVAGPIGEAQNPPRLFIDLPGVVPGAEMALSAGQGPLLRLRAAVNSLDPLVTRVVLDLRARAAYHYHLEPGTTNDNELTVVLASPPATESATPRVLWSGLDDNFIPVSSVRITLDQRKLFRTIEPGHMVEFVNGHATARETNKRRPECAAEL